MCAAVHPVVDDIVASFPETRLVEYQVWRNRPNMKLLRSLVEARGEPIGTPALFVGDRYWIGLSEAHRREIEQAIRRCLEEGCVDPLKNPSTPASSDVPQTRAKDELVTIPLLGEVEAGDASLPLLTVVLGLLDSFNPCAFFVLLFLLGLLVHARSRVRMLVIGCTFVFISGLVYFFFMAAWLNFFLVAGGVRIVTIVAGILALIVAVLNIKDFFLFKQGVSLSLTKEHRGSLARRIRSLVQASRFPSMLFGTAVLAIAANSYELLCTAGLPMVFTRVLTLQEMPAVTYYLYLAAYNVIYTLPLLAIVMVFSWTLGKHQMSEWQGRELKLVSGSMMFMFGLVLLTRPEWLTSAWVAVGLLGLALAAALLIIVLYRVRHPEIRRRTSADHGR